MRPAKTDEHHHGNRESEPCSGDQQQVAGVVRRAAGRFRGIAFRLGPSARLGCARAGHIRRLTVSELKALAGAVLEGGRPSAPAREAEAEVVVDERAASAEALAGWDRLDPAGVEVAQYEGWLRSLRQSPA